MNPKLLSCLAWVAVVIANCAISAAADYFVSPDGKSTNDGSEQSPWPSVQFALDKVKGGNTIILKSGVYAGPIDVPDAYAGSEQAPTVIRAQEKWKAVIIGSPKHCIYLGDHCHWTIIDGLEIAGARYDGIKANGDHVVIRNCWIHNNTEMGIGMHHAHNSTIENNLIEFNGCHPQFHHGIYVDGDGLTISRNIIRHNAGFGMHLYPKIQNSRVFLNLVYDHEHHAGVLLSCDKAGGANQVYQNTIAEKLVALEIWNDTGTKIFNNVLTAGVNPPVTFPHGKAHPIANYNLCWPQSEYAGPNGISAEPAFVDARHGAYWLASQSVAIGKGSADLIAPADFWNRTVAAGTAPDMGAFAYVPALCESAARSAWQDHWGYGYHPTKGHDLPDYWALPKGP